METFSWYQIILFSINHLIQSNMTWSTWEQKQHQWFLLQFELWKFEHFVFIFDYFESWAKKDWMSCIIVIWSMKHNIRSYFKDKMLLFLELDPISTFPEDEDLEFSEFCRRSMICLGFCFSSNLLLSNLSILPRDVRYVSTSIREQDSPLNI